MKIESVAITNYKVFQQTEVTNLPGMSIFLGKNGSGKTTVLTYSVFCMTA